jgi:sulfur relay (sulfurtransferase) complex TusBCD TusD component (DsrE family)
MDARGISDTDLPDGTRRSALEQLADWTQWADRTMVF